jgi:hypothetical protein
MVTSFGTPYCPLRPHYTSCNCLSFQRLGEILLQDKDRQRLQRTKRIPNEFLDELIRRVNLLRGRTKLLPLEVNSWDFANEDDNEAAARAQESLSQHLSGLPEEFQRYIWHGDSSHIDTVDERDQSSPVIDSPASLKEAVIRYEQFIDLHDRFHTLATYVGLALRLESRPPFNIEIPLPRGQFPTSKPASIKIKILSGKVHFPVDEFYRALDGVELRRIRRCEVCGNIFWAGRFDKKTCSDNCKNTNNVRRLRERRKDDPEAYNKKRKQNDDIRAGMDRKRAERAKRERVEKRK